MKLSVVQSHAVRSVKSTLAAYVQDLKAERKAVKAAGQHTAKLSRQINSVSADVDKLNGLLEDGPIRPAPASECWEGIERELNSYLEAAKTTKAQMIEELTRNEFFGADNAIRGYGLEAIRADHQARRIKGLLNCLDDLPTIEEKLDGLLPALETFEAELGTEVHQVARWGTHRSTSAIANVMDEAKLMADADLLDEIRRRQRFSIRMRVEMFQSDRELAAASEADKVEASKWAISQVANSWEAVSQK